MKGVTAVTVLAIFLAACASTPRTAAEALSAGATANPVLVATAQADQYWRDAQATATAQQAALNANYQQVAATAQAGTATAVFQTTAQALSLRATEQSLQATGTTQALESAALAAEATSEIEETATARSATVSAQGTAAAMQATRQTLALAQAEAQAQREQLLTAVTSTLLITLATALVVLLLWLLWRLIPMAVSRAGLVRYGQHQNPLLLLDRHGRTVLADPLALLQPTVVVDEEAGVTMPELVPNDIQTLIAGGRLRLLMEQAQHPPGHAPQLPAETIHRRRVGPVETERTVRHGPVPAPVIRLPAGTPTHPDSEPPYVPGSIPWEQLSRWSGPGLALGSGRGNEIIAVDLARCPHLFAAGMSGSGKTRRLLRPLVAQALAGGYFIVLMNESGADFSPFYGQANIKILRGTAADYMGLFAAAMEEMERREGQLRAAQVSEWRRLPAWVRAERPPVLLAVDELLSLAVLLQPGEQRQFWRLIAAFASRARKVGMCSIGLATDPTYRALGQGGLNYRAQCARVSFRVMQAASSRAILDAGGAETLNDGQFMALLDSPGVVRGMTANPSDRELRAYLAQNPAPDLVAPAWLGKVEAPTVGEEDETGETEGQIREMLREGLTMREIQRQVYGYVGGAAYEAVRQVRDALDRETDGTTVV